ncbi:MAG: hypothetical protein JW715_01905 [Sedimentisphaerales bacterium]|nr:hypothetical protein [Sedimentisphaerales bacterium]
MKIQGIIHQQICQFKWHLLACFGLIMVLPIEEALVNFKDGLGFRCGSMVLVSIMFSPLLAGLIACANVQGDMDQKLYIFWRSKPAGIKLLVSLKFFVGLTASLIIMTCPLIFWLLSGNIIDTNSDILYSIPLSALLSIMTYSLCFGCNVLIRSTARAWLVGMLLAGFCLILPFILPLNYRDFVSDVIFGSRVYYPVIMLIISAAAFVFALFAAQYDWHLKTNLKGLLWVAGGLVFVLLMLFSSQVANIKVLQELEIEPFMLGRNDLDYAGDKVIFQEHNYVDIDNNKISFSNIDSNPDDIAVPITRPEGLEEYHTRDYPGRDKLIKVVGDNLYSFSILAYFSRERIDREGKPPLNRDIYEHAYLRSYKYTVNRWIPICEIDISECLTDHSYSQIALRLIDNKIIAIINNSFVLIDATNPEELKRLDTKLDVLKRPMGYIQERRKEFSIPLVPVEGIDIEDRIKLSIDLNYQYEGIDERSIVDIHDEKISFFLASYYDDIRRFDVTGWDSENIYCKLSTARPFTILEHMSSVYLGRVFVKNGKLYFSSKNTLLVFDIRSGDKIRKLGHFIRMDYSIQDIAVLDDDNILLCMRWDRNLSNYDSSEKNFLCLLKNPG